MSSEDTNPTVVTEEARTDIGTVPFKPLSVADFRRWGLEGNAQATLWRVGMREYTAADPKVLEIKKRMETQYGQEIIAAAIKAADLRSELEMLKLMLADATEELRDAKLAHRRLLHSNSSVNNHALNKLVKLLCKRKKELGVEFKRQWRNARTMKRKAELLEGKQADHAQV